MSTSSSQSYVLQHLVRVGVVLLDDLADVDVVPDVVVLHPLQDLPPALDLFPNVLFFDALVLDYALEHVALVARELERVRGRNPLEQCVDYGLLVLGEAEHLDDFFYAPDLDALDSRLGQDDYYVEVLQQPRRQVDGRRLEAVHHRVHGIAVDCGHAGVPRRHPLEQYVSLLATHFSHDYLVGPLTQRSPEQVVHAYLAALAPSQVLAAEPRAHHFLQPVLVGQAHLGRVLDGHDFHFVGQEHAHRVQERRLAGRCAASAQERAPVLDCDPQVRPNHFGEGAEVQQVGYRQRVLGELPDGERGAVHGDVLVRRERCLDAAPVGQRAVQQGVGDADVLAAPLRHADDELVQYFFAGESDVGGDAGVLPVVYVQRYLHAVARDVLDIGVVHEPLDVAEAQEVSVHEVQDFFVGVLVHGHAVVLDDRVHFVL